MTRPTLSPGTSAALHDPQQGMTWANEQIFLEAEMDRHDDAEKKADGNGSGTYDPDKIEDPSKDGGKHDEDKRG